MTEPILMKLGPVNLIQRIFQAGLVVPKSTSSAVGLYKVFA